MSILMNLKGGFRNALAVVKNKAVMDKLLEDAWNRECVKATPVIQSMLKRLHTLYTKEGMGADNWKLYNRYFHIIRVSDGVVLKRRKRLVGKVLALMPHDCVRNVKRDIEEEGIRVRVRVVPTPGSEEAPLEEPQEGGGASS